MLLLLLAVAATSPTQARTAPPAPTVVPMPPPVYIPTPVQTGPAVRFVVDVDVHAGSTLLWSGPLRVGGGYGQTSVRREQTEPGDATCGRFDSVSAVATSFTLSLNARGREDGVFVTVRWSRPGDQPCSPGPNTRTVELSASADLPPGGSATLNGDGGLTVRLRRR